jgi:membrane protein YdbS with pleckstrin-like domain
VPQTESRSRDPFGAPAEGWRGVSQRLATVRRISVLAPVALVSVIAAVAAAVVDQAWLAVMVLLLGLAVSSWIWWLIGRQVAAMGYALRNDDLVVVSGIMFRRLVVVPYGRMQLVDVTSGPLDRRFGLASVQLHTAAATTDASVPGLPQVDAADLRDRLAALGESRSAGL